MEKTEVLNASLPQYSPMKLAFSNSKSLRWIKSLQKGRVALGEEESVREQLHRLDIHKFVVCDWMHPQLMSLQSYSQLSWKGHGKQEGFLRTVNSRPRRRIQASRPPLPPCEGNTRNPGNHFQTREAKEGDWEQEVWVYTGEIMTDPPSSLLQGFI